jgi:hypothetical protein
VLKSVCEKREERIYIDRAACGDSDYRHLGSYPVPCVLKGKGTGAESSMCEQYAADWDGVNDVCSGLG